MSKFLYLYTAGRMPDTPEGIEEMMSKWHAYFGALGPKLIDGGAPCGDRACVGGGEPSPINGYSIVDAGSLDEAKSLTDGHPHLEFDGAIEVVALMDM